MVGWPADAAPVTEARGEILTVHGFGCVIADGTTAAPTGVTTVEEYGLGERKGCDVQLELVDGMCDADEKEGRVVKEVELLMLLIVADANNGGWVWCCGWESQKLEVEWLKVQFSGDEKVTEDGKKPENVEDGVVMLVEEKVTTGGI